MNVMYIYKKDNLELIAQPVISTIDEFNENPEKFYPDWNSETMAYSDKFLNNPVIDEITGQLREMTEYEKAKAGKITLKEGQYLDESNKSIVTLKKPNEYSIWDKETHEWIEDKTLKKDFLEHKKYELQKKYIELKSEKEKLEAEKKEFELLEFDTKLTIENIKTTDEEMKKIISEIKEITKILKAL